MVATTQQTISWKRFRDDPTDLEAVYFRWIQPGAAAPTITGRAEQIFRHHLELAAGRRPGTALTRLYRAGDGSDLGPALQIVNDDMPLLVDSLTAALQRLGATVTEVVHPVFDVLRDRRGRLRAIAPSEGFDVAQENPASRGESSGNVVTESWIHVQLGAGDSDAVLDRIERALPPLLAELRQVAHDTEAMTRTMAALAARLDVAPQPAAREAADCAQLLRWLTSGHFTLLGYGYYRVHPAADGPEPQQVSGTALGVLRSGTGVDVGAVATGADRILRLSNGSLDSLLPGSPDVYVVSVADYGAETTPSAEGTVVGEHVFVGTFTVSGLHENILDIPVISRRVHQVIEWAGLALNSFSGQALLEMLQTFPRVELFSTDARRLFETVSAVMNLGLRRQIRLFLRRDAGSNAVYCLVYLPRDRYSTEVRTRMHEILRREFDAEQIAYSARVTESELAVVYFTVHRGADAEPADITEANRERVQDLLFATTRSWSDRLVSAAAGAAELEPTVVADYAAAFPASYRQEYEPRRALDDLRRLQKLPDGGIDTDLYRVPGAPAGEWRFALYVAGAEVSLSRVLPVLHSLGAEVLEEKPYRLELPDATRWVYDFGLRVAAHTVHGAADADPEADLDPSIAPESLRPSSIRRRLPEAVAAMWFGDCEVDGLNELVLRAGLHWREIAVLRAYAKYLQQAGFAYTFGNITRVLLTQPGAARAFTELFDAYFDPDHLGPVATARAAGISARLQDEIDAVVGLDTDRILRAVLGLVTATLRTNYFRRDEDGRPPAQLSFKFDPHAIAELPRPRPKFEIFVYSPRVEGVHLRFGAVARGGLRWSDRLEDFRTEILGLVKAQAVKNAVIVPVGAKGGFVVKRPPALTGDAAADRQATLAEGVACYRSFISGLLDLTDNVDHVSGAVLPPEGVVRRDGDDTYLVVAADKGTATFSDIANEVARQYDFWLGDAFASGGSAGYDHKAMGITAKGAWESV
ncbi:NAD-glutamate dehydrogenase domain-containing protein, partial [Nocardia nova]|uniref:NAD-glutamate dehydrogenase domain-containing protein n=1 Tax=Nocardia nova TaxID=37330 RepID=UPI00340993E8